MSDVHATSVVNPRIVGQQLYRLFDADGDLLYIGISYSAIARYAQHKAGQPWIGDVCTVTIETHDVSRSEIEAMEAAAIRSEKPRYNVKRSRSPWAGTKAEPFSEFNHSWPASSARLREDYWAVQRRLPALLSTMADAGCNVNDLTAFVGEIVNGSRYTDAHHECQDERWQAEMPVEQPFARAGDGWCHYVCRLCGQTWRCRY